MFLAFMVLIIGVRLRVDTICSLVLRTLGKAILKIKDALF